MVENEQLDNEEQLKTEDEFQSALEEAMKEQFEKVRMAGLLTGAKGVCGVVMQYIDQFSRSPGKRTLNDYRRLVKKINEFCSISLGKKVDEETGEIVDVEPDKNTNE